MSDLDRVKKLAGILTEEMDKGDMHDALGDAMIAMDQANQSVRAVSDELEKDFYKDESVEEAVGDFAKPIYDLIDELGDTDQTHANVLHDLIRYLDGDTIKDFVDEFRRVNDYGDGLEYESVKKEAVK